MQWNHLEQVGDLSALERKSSEHPVLVFKHSKRCGLSHEVRDQLEEHWTVSDDAISCYQLDILTYRPVSNAIEERWGIPHQSPQAIVLYDGEVVYNNSHRAITAESIMNALSGSKNTVR